MNTQTPRTNVVVTPPRHIKSGVLETTHNVTVTLIKFDPPGPVHCQNPTPLEYLKMDKQLCSARDMREIAAWLLEVADVLEGIDRSTGIIK